MPEWHEQGSSTMMATIASQLSAVRPQRTPCRRRPGAGQAAALREQAVAKPYGFVQAKLTVGAVNDPLEHEADAAADRVMRMDDPGISLSSGPTLSRECATCEEEGKAGNPLRRDVASGGMDGAVAPPIVHDVLNSPGRPLDPATHDFMSSRFGADFGEVRIHTDAHAARSAKAVNARAYAVGRDIVFASGQYDPGGERGRRLLAHELAHVVQGGHARTSIRRNPLATATADPLCGRYDFLAKKTVLEQEVQNLAGAGDVEVRLKVIQDLKIFHRCASETEVAAIQAILIAKLGAALADELWKSAGTAFGGYRGVYPGYYSGRKWLSGLGTSEVEATPTFPYPEATIEPHIFDPRGEKIAPEMAKKIERADILYFYGHQYAQYGNPGAFANGDQDKFIDVRKLAGKGNFTRVKLLISSSCATICKEALDEFTPLFPNAVILGYRKSAPEDGEAIRKSFDAAIKALKKPLLLNEPLDVAAIIEVWKSVVKKHHPKEGERLPGYYQGGTVHYLQDGIWQSMLGTDPANACKVKGTQIQQARHRGP
jgi:hypothetical protein